MTTNLIQITPTMDVIVGTNVGELEALFTSDKGLSDQVEYITRVAKNAIIDITTEQGQNELRLLAKNISAAKKKMDAEGKKICDYLKARPTLVDKTRKKMRDALDALEIEILAPLTEIEKRKEDVQKIKQMHLTLSGADSSTIMAVLEEAHTIVMTEEVWKETFNEARIALKAEINLLTSMHANAEKREAREAAEKAELERLRKEQEEAQRIIREEQIRKAAEEKAAAEKAKIEEENKRLKAEIEKSKSNQPPQQPKTKNVAEKPATSGALKKAAAELKEALLPLVGGDAEIARNIGIAIYRGQLPHVTFTP